MKVTKCPHYQPGDETKIAQKPKSRGSLLSPSFRAANGVDGNFTVCKCGAHFIFDADPSRVFILNVERPSVETSGAQNG